MAIFLLGFMGCGKSTVARGLARLSGWRTIDLDEMVCQRVGAESVAEIFATHGEEFFRRAERECLELLGSQDEKVIVATGGGAPCYGDNMQLIRNLGVTVYLKMSAEALSERLGHVRIVRPKVAGMTPEERLDYVRTELARREPFYSQSCIVVDCNNIPSKVVVSRLSYLVKKRR